MEGAEAGETTGSAVISISRFVSSLSFAFPRFLDLLVFVVAAGGATAGLVVGSKGVDGASAFGNSTLALPVVGIVVTSVEFDHDDTGNAAGSTYALLLGLAMTGELGDVPLTDWDLFDG